MCMGDDLRIKDERIRLALGLRVGAGSAIGQ